MLFDPHRSQAGTSNYHGDQVNYIVTSQGHSTQRAKSRDRGIVRAQEKVPNGRRKTPPKSWSVVVDPQVLCEVICDQVLNQLLFSMNFYSCRSSCMMKQNKAVVVSVQSAVVSQFCVRPTSKRWFLKIIQVTMKHDPFDTVQESMQT